MHERQEMHEEDEDNLQERHSADLQQAQQQPAGASIQSIATQAAAAMAAAMVAQQLLASAAATCGLDLASLSQFAIMAASQSSQQQQQAGAGAPQTPEQLMAAAVAAATFLSHTSQANQLAATASQLQAAGALNPLGQLNSNSSSNSNLNLSLAQAAAILPEDLTTLAEHQHALKLEQHGGGGGGGSANGAVGNANNNAPTLSHLHHQLNLGAAQQANSNQALGLNLVANNLHGHHAASSIGPIRGGARHQQQHNVEQQQQHHHHHQYQRHGSSSSSGGSSATSDTQTHNNSSSSLGAIANNSNSNNNNAHNHHQSHHHQNQNHHHHNNNNNSNSHGHSHGHPHHQTTRHLLGHHHHSSIQTQQQLLATKGYNPLAVVVGSGQQTEILTPTHLRKAKLMFFYVRYPNSSTLKECFRDVRFNKNNTAQLVKWFSNFREFYYIQMEKFARDAIIDERIRCKEDIVVTYDHELINVLNNHYNKNRHIELPEVFRQVVEETLRHFFDAIHTKRDQEQSWKKAIYKVIARLDQEVPELFKTDAFNEHLE